MDGKTKSIDKVSLIKEHFVSVEVTSPTVTIRDPNFCRRRELEPISNPIFVLLPKRTMYTLGFMRGRRRSDFEGSTILRRRQAYFMLTRPNLLTKHYQGLSDSYRTMNQGKKEKARRTYKNNLALRRIQP